MMAVSVVKPHACSTLGEAPHWNGRTQSLYYVDAYSGDYYQWNPVTGDEKKFHAGIL